MLISAMSEGSTVSDTFILSRKSLRETKSGKPYLAASLMDSSGQIEARVWEAATDLNDMFDEGDSVRVDGRVESFKGQLQVNVHKMQASSVEAWENLPKCDVYGEEMIDLLGTRIPELLDDKELLNLVNFALYPEGEAFEQASKVSTLFRFAVSPAASYNHDARIGGLANHSMRVASRVKVLAKDSRIRDPQLAIAGAILHDIGKVVELEPNAGFSYTSIGKFIGHIGWGIHHVLRTGSKVLGEHTDRVGHLAHIVASHHSKKEYGSPVEPKSPEAMLVAQVDMLDTRLQMAEETFSDSPGDSEAGFIDTSRPIGREVYMSPGNGGQSDE